MDRQKRILAINDISCFGKCSLTVALPILSAAGYEVCPLPTALLSTHTGGFSEYTFKNLDDQMIPVAEHWKKCEIEFDAIYSGYLGSYEQLEYVKKILNNFSKPGVTVLIDPVMGDNGKLYAGFEEKFAKGMLDLCRRADIIVPNITEVCYMLDIPYKERYNESEIIDVFEKFSEIGIKKIVITGINMEDGNLCCGVYDDGDVSFIKRKKVPGMYHGTGDVFAAALLSAYEKGLNLNKSTEFAVWFVLEAILITQKRYGDSHYGVDFEPLLHMIVEKLQEIG